MSDQVKNSPTGPYMMSSDQGLENRIKLAAQRRGDETFCAFVRRRQSWSDTRKESKERD